MQNNGKAIYQGLKDTANQVKEWVLDKNDCCMGKITAWLAKKFGLGLTPTQSRWGIISILSALALFFIALFPALFLSSREGRMNHGLLYGSIAIASIGGLIALFTLLLSAHFLRYQKEDVLIQNMHEIQSKLALLDELPLIKQEIKNIGQTIEKLANAMLESRKNNGTTK